MKYTFIGDYPETFLDLGKELHPGDIVETDNAIDHPRLQVVEDKPTRTQPAKAQQARVEVSE